MMQQRPELPLDKLPMGKTGIVAALLPEAAARRRLMDLGIVDGTEIRPLYKSASGDPAAYLIRGAVIALRADTAGKIRMRAE